MIVQALRNMRYLYVEPGFCELYESNPIILRLPHGSLLHRVLFCQDFFNLPVCFYL